MRFKNKENGREHELNRVEGTDFWHNNHDELFIVDEPTGYCYQTTALNAVESLLRRKITGNGLCCLCLEVPHQSKPRASKGHEENYLDKYSK